MLGVTMAGWIVWLSLLGSSAAIGVLSGRFVEGNRGIFLGAAIPWFALLAYLLIAEYVLPYHGGGASMWPIAQLFGGTAAAVAGLIAATIAQEVRHRRKRRSNA